MTSEEKLQEFLPDKLLSEHWSDDFRKPDQRRRSIATEIGRVGYNFAVDTKTAEFCIKHDLMTKVHRRSGWDYRVTEKGEIYYTVATRLDWQSLLDTGRRITVRSSYDNEM